MKTLTSALALTLAGALLAGPVLAQSGGGTSGGGTTGGNAQSPAMQQPGTGTTGTQGAKDSATPEGAKAGSKAQAQGAGASKEQLRAAQEALKKHGMYEGQVDGIMGPKTRAAVQEFQKKEGLQTTGRLDQQTLSRLGVEEGGAGTPAASPPTGGQQQDKPASPPASGQQQDKPATGKSGDTKDNTKK